MCRSSAWMRWVTATSAITAAWWRICSSFSKGRSRRDRAFRRCRWEVWLIGRWRRGIESVVRRKLRGGFAHSREGYISRSHLAMSAIVEKLFSQHTVALQMKVRRGAKRKTRYSNSSYKDLCVELRIHWPYWILWSEKKTAYRTGAWGCQKDSFMSAVRTTPLPPR